MRVEEITQARQLFGVAEIFGLDLLVMGLVEDLVARAGFAVGNTGGDIRRWVSVGLLTIFAFGGVVRFFIDHDRGGVRTAFVAGGIVIRSFGG